MLMQRELAAGAAELGVGCRRGERLYALKAMMEQDGAATSSGSGSRCVLGWPIRQGLRRHGTGRWWSHRARDSSEVLTTMAGEVS